MSQTVSGQDINELFQSAAADGLISQDTYQALQVVDIGQMIQNGMGTPADDVTSSEVTLIGMLMDDSYSMRSEAQAARDGHNQVIQALNESKQKDSVLITTVYLNDGPLTAFCSLEPSCRIGQPKL